MYSLLFSNVSGIHVPIIRRKLLYLCETGICHSVCVASGLLVGFKLFQSNQQTRRHPYRVANTSVAWIEQFSPDDGHLDGWNMYTRVINKYIKQNCATSRFYLRDYTGMHSQENIKNELDFFGNGLKPKDRYSKQGLSCLYLIFVFPCIIIYGFIRTSLMQIV